MKYRTTKQREKILKLLRQTRKHPTANWIFKKLRTTMPKVSLGTVYRNLNILVEQGLIQRMTLDGMMDRFDATIIPHSHLICENCGVISDWKIPPSKDIDRLAEEFCDFTINRHRIDFYGICKNCQSS